MPVICRRNVSFRASTRGSSMKTKGWRDIDVQGSLHLGLNAIDVRSDTAPQFRHRQSPIDRQFLPVGAYAPSRRLWLEPKKRLLGGSRVIFELVLGIMLQPIVKLCSQLDDR